MTGLMAMILPSFLRRELPKPVKIFIPSRSHRVRREWERLHDETTDKLRNELGVRK